MVAAAGNISLLKEDYTEENRYFGNVLGMTLLNCHLGLLSSLCKNIFCFEYINNFRVPLY